MESTERIAVKKKVIEFVAQQTDSQPDELDENTDLFRDLRVEGDDVDDLFLEFSKEFNFPLCEIDVRGCFPGELPFFDLFFRPKRRVRIRHLIDAVLSKKWPELDNL
jgi:hypothetical protein